VKTRFSILLLCAVMTATVAAQSNRTAATTLRVRGTIQKCDVSARRLSVTTPTGTVQFLLASSARIRQGGREIAVSVLEKLAGYRVDVHYSESDGQKTAQSVHVVGKAKG
jgi:DUF971 family protein